MRNKALSAKRRRAPTIVNRTLPPPRRPYAELRPREFLTGEEVERLRKAAGDRLGRKPHRDSTMILIAYRHGLRVSEFVGLRRDMLDLDQGLLHVRRLKRGRPSTHMLRGGELRALRRLRREQVPPSPYLFTTERRGPLTAAGFRKLLARVG
jgi:type 1 fimbriae regulatory protein FimB/type 1 fimbriae regulatory protein FimE